MSDWDGDIVFKNSTKEFLRFKGDGRILVEGRPMIGRDVDVVRAVKAWLASVGVCPPLRDRDSIVVQSGTGMKDVAKGGDTVLIQP